MFQSISQLERLQQLVTDALKPSLLQRCSPNPGINLAIDLVELEDFIHQLVDDHCSRLSADTIPF